MSAVAGSERKLQGAPCPSWPRWSRTITVLGFLVVCPSSCYLLTYLLTYLCRCFGAPARRVFPDHLITYFTTLRKVSAVNAPTERVCAVAADPAAPRWRPMAPRKTSRALVTSATRRHRNHLPSSRRTTALRSRCVTLVCSAHSTRLPAHSPVCCAGLQFPGGGGGRGRR